ncbi:hypothetical protein G6F56_006750 [Rhizopus delemar]|nr:hypothetical protein G6F56_006750 [Rhizopus delemar]
METYRNDSIRETRQHMVDFFRQGLSYCRPLSANGDTTANENLSFPIAPIPVYHLDRTLKTVDEVWKEYSVGIKGGPDVEMLEFEHGTLWRKDRTEVRY